MPAPHTASPVVFWIPLLWIAGWLAASLFYRKLRGKPIFYARLPNTRFLQTNASGRSHRHWFTRLGGANGCLVVQVTETELDIHPFPPFNWLFLPEIYGLEYRVPLTNVRSAELRKRFFRSSVDVVLQADEGETKVSLFLAYPDEFLKALGMTNWTDRSTAHA
ncbi:MAG: hypothetical protein E6J88_10770 [Deltaproteobacteria bacterium]|nr:MAG: hypothetical protein E6J88_10770 [Deltaproteobacteria bacterium]